jgi:hypothetical protein
MTKRIWSPVGFIGFLVSASLLSQQADVPLTNWTVPPYTHAVSGITTMADVTPPRAFVGIQPCRVADTRGNGAPIQGGIFANSEVRNWDITGICGIPDGTDAISVNFTVVSTAATPQGAFMLAWPTGSPPSPIVALMTYGPGVTILSNSAIVPLATGELLTVNVSHSTHVIMDVNGYFSDRLGNQLNNLVLWNNSAATPTMELRNLSTSCGVPGCGIYVQAESGNAIFGSAHQTGPTNVNHGVRGETNSSAPASAGVYGTGLYKGVAGFSGNVGDAAGVFGSYFPAIQAPGGYNVHGVRGEGALGGVLGISPTEGTAGSLISGGVEIAFGVLGLTSGLGVDPGCPSSPCSGPWAVFAGGNIGATGAKYFVEPHPTDADLVVGYISLEGPEAGTYFRGRARFQNGLARIAVPEHFRWVTDSEGLTVQITPIGEMASFAVVKMDLNEIVVKSSRNVEFSYLVQGVRASLKNASPVFRSRSFMPRSADAEAPRWLTAAQKRLLIQNGTYREDGTVNRETAQRLGWDRIWQEHSAPEGKGP